MADLIAEDAAGRHVVSVAEPARNAQNLELVQQPRIFERAIDVQRRGCPARSKAYAVSTSQFVPGARKIKARG